MNYVVYLINNLISLDQNFHYHNKLILYYYSIDLNLKAFYKFVLLYHNFIGLYHYRSDFDGK